MSYGPNEEGEGGCKPDAVAILGSLLSMGTAIRSYPLSLNTGSKPCSIDTLWRFTMAVLYSVSAKGSSWAWIRRFR